jgi:hypothetical protein
MGGGFDQMWVPQFPAENVTFWFAAILRVPWGDTNRRFPVSGRICTEDREELGWRLDGQLEAGRPPGRRAGDVVLPVAGPIGFTLQAAGRVIATLTFADDERSFSVDISRQPSLQTPPAVPPAA